MVNNMAKKYKGLQLEIRKFYKNNFNLVVQIVDRIPQGYVDNQGLVYGMAGVCNSKGRNWDLYTETTEDELIKQNAVNYKGESPSEAVAENVADEVIRTDLSYQGIFTYSNEFSVDEEAKRNLEALKKMGRSIQSIINSSDRVSIDNSLFQSLSIYSKKLREAEAEISQLDDKFDVIANSLNQM